MVDNAPRTEFGEPRRVTSMGFSKGRFSSLSPIGDEIDETLRSFAAHLMLEEFV